MGKRLTGPKIKAGQVWRRNLYRNPTKDIHDIIITRGGEYPRGKRRDLPHIQHHFKPKSLWLYWELVGTEINCPPLPPAVFPHPHP